MQREEPDVPAVALRVGVERGAESPREWARVIGGEVDALEVGDARGLRRDDDRGIVRREGGRVAARRVVWSDEVQRARRPGNDRRPPPSAGLLRRRDVLAVGGESGPGIGQARRPGGEQPHVARGEADLHDVAGAAETANPDGELAVGRRFRVANAGAARDAPQVVAARIPEKQVGTEAAAAQRLLTRDEHASPVGHEARVLVRASAHGPERRQRLRATRPRRPVGDVLGVSRLRLCARTFAGAVGRRLRGAPDFDSRRLRQRGERDREPRPITRHRGRPHPAIEAGDALAHRHSLRFALPPGLERPRRHVHAELRVERGRRVAERAREGLLERARLPRAQPAPELRQRAVPALRHQPLEKGGTNEIAHRPAEKRPRVIEPTVAWQHALERPLAQHRGAPRAVGPAAPGEHPLDVGRVSLDHPRGNAAREWPERGHDRKREDESLPRIASRPHEVRHVRELVHGEQFTPAGVMTDRAARIGGRRPEKHRRAAEVGQGDAVGGVDRIVDHEVDHHRRRIPDEFHHLLAHRLDAPRHVQRPRGLLRAMVQTEMRRGDRPPGLCRVRSKRHLRPEVSRGDGQNGNDQDLAKARHA